MSTQEKSNQKIEKVFEHSEVVVKNQRVLEKRRVKRNHVEVRWEKKNVRNLFIIRGQVVGLQ
jgi:hypothetical protein